MMRRSADQYATAALIISLLVAGVIAIFGFPALLDVNRLVRENQAQADQLARESRERRDQMCNLFERDHLADVTRLKRTYAYLDRLPRREWGNPLTMAIVRQLPELEVEARQDAAPPFCDEPGIGLPEPDPELPARQDFSRLLRRP